MTGLTSMIKLDLFTMKSQSVSYLSLLAIVLLFAFMGSSVIILCITGAWFIALMSVNIFAIQEKNNLDRLYGSVSVSLHDIVLGRYMFLLLNYLLSIMTVIVLHLTISLYHNTEIAASDIFLGVSLSFLVFSAITGIQIPLFFKMGYTKAKTWSLLPFIAVMLLVFIPSFVSAFSGVIAFMQSNTKAFIIGGIVINCIVQLISYRVSVFFYRKRT